MTMIQLVLLLLPTEFWKHCTLSWKSRKDIVLSHGTAWHQFSNLSIFLRRNEAIGITTGRAFCGVVGHMDRHEYTGRFLLSFSSSSSFSQPPLPHPPSLILHSSFSSFPLLLFLSSSFSSFLSPTFLSNLPSCHYYMLSTFTLLVIGSKVNMAARLMMNYPNIVSCDEETYKAAISKLNKQDFDPLPPKPLKGIAEPGTIREYTKDHE